MPTSNQLDDTEIEGSTVEPEEWEDGEGDAEGDLDYEEDVEEDDGADAEAEEFARRLGDQLWADINKAQADRAVAVSASVSTRNVLPHSLSDLSKESQPQPSAQPVIQPPPQYASKREEAAIATIKAILSHAAKDALVLSVFTSTVVPECHGQNILNVFNRIALDGTISKDIAKPLSDLCLSLARSETLFSRRHQSTAQLDKGKRKRNQNDEADHSDDLRFQKKPSYAPRDFPSQIADAVRVITEALSTNPSPGAMNPALISSIQLQLHQIFLFAVTSSAAGGPEMHALQELSGLIQVIGVLSGIPISSTLLGAPHDPKSIPFDSNQFNSNNDNNTPWITGSSTDIGTAVYPCLSPSCRKFFSRLYSLRAHQRVHSIHRPFHCSSCPASFARNHDLKRHAKLHDKRAWKCCGCNKVFSRRDAIKRHKKTSKTRGNKTDACPNAEVMEVDLANQGESVKEERRAKMWNGIAGSGTSGIGNHGEDKTLEEGEVDGGAISRAQAAVLGLHALLQSHVASNLGLSPGNSPQDLDPTAGQATLASIIARAQWQNPSLQSASLQKPDGHPTESPGTVGGQRLQHQPSQTSGPNGPDQTSTEPHTIATASLSCYGLSEDQTRMLEQAIANAALAAQAQAEAEAALEEEEEGERYDEDVDDVINGDGDDGDGEDQA